MLKKNSPCKESFLSKSPLIVYSFFIIVIVKLLRKIIKAGEKPVLNHILITLDNVQNICRRSVPGWGSVSQLGLHGRVQQPSRDQFSHK